MNSSLSDMEVMDIRYITVLDEIDKSVNSLVNNKIIDYDEKLALLRATKALYEIFRNSMIWVLGKHGRDEFYTHDYLEILDRMKNETDNKYLKAIIEKQKKKVNKKIDEMRKKFSKIEGNMLMDLDLFKKKLTLPEEKRAKIEQVRAKIEQIRVEEKNIIDVYNKIKNFGKDLLKGINQEKIKQFAEDNFKRTPSQYVALETSKDTLALLLLHYSLREVKDDTFYLIEEALYTRQIPLKAA